MTTFEGLAAACFSHHFPYWYWFFFGIPARWVPLIVRPIALFFSTTLSLSPLSKKILSVFARMRAQTKVHGILAEIPEEKSSPLRFSGSPKVQADILQVLDTFQVVNAVKVFWEKICLEHGFDPTQETFGLMAYQITELCKNAVEYGVDDNTEIRDCRLDVSFRENAVEVVLTDNGAGFDSHPNDYIQYNLDHGLDGCIRYADEFSLETRGVKYEKRKKAIRVAPLKKTGTSDVRKGTKIRFLKNLSSSRTL